MDSDFHFYGTGTAALHAGFGSRDAQRIAFAAQFLDWFNSDYWCQWKIVDARGRSLTNPRTRRIYRYRNPQLTIQTVDWKLSFDYDPNIWTTFHFPPGNRAYRTTQSGWRKQFQTQHVVRKTCLSSRDAGKLCRPYSKFALDLIDDTLQQFQQLWTFTNREAAEYVDEQLSHREVCEVPNGRQLALYFLGIRMHVLADTWAHQDFAGERSAAINTIGDRSTVRWKGNRGRMEPMRWTGAPWVLNDNTDCGAAPDAARAGEMVAGGHAQLGYLPDYSWVTYRYSPAWLPQGTEFHERDNPKEYKEAWSWMAFVLEQCNEVDRASQSSLANQALSENTVRMPREVNTAISKWQPLSTEHFDAFQRKEHEWKNTKLGKRIHRRGWEAMDWPKLKTGPLGLVGGLSKTRLGTIRVKRGSVLHYMETAAALHYQFCLNWSKENPRYEWELTESGESR